MNGIHDMGGMHGFGRVEREDERARLPRDVGRRASSGSAARAACSGIFNIDESRHAIERMAPVDYLGLELLRALARSQRAPARREGRDHARGAGAPHGPAGRRDRSGAAALGPQAARAHAARDEGPHAVPAARAAAALRARRPRPHAVTTRRSGTRGCRATRAASPGSSCACTGPSSFRTPTPTGRASSLTRSTACASTAPMLWGDSAEPRAPVHLDLWERYLEPAAPARSTS